MNVSTIFIIFPMSMASLNLPSKLPGPPRDCSPFRRCATHGCDLHAGAATLRVAHKGTEDHHPAEHGRVRLASGERNSAWLDHTHDGSMYVIYGNMDPINIPQMGSHIYQHHGSVMGYWTILDLGWPGMTWDGNLRAASTPCFLQDPDSGYFTALAHKNLLGTQRCGCVQVYTEPHFRLPALTCPARKVPRECGKYCIQS
jgi:hypothetical protein